MKKEEITQEQFISIVTRSIDDGIIDIDERINTGRVEALVRRTLKKAFKKFIINDN